MVVEHPFTRIYPFFINPITTAWKTTITRGVFMKSGKLAEQKLSCFLAEMQN